MEQYKVNDKATMRSDSKGVYVTHAGHRVVIKGYSTSKGNRHYIRVECQCGKDLKILPSSIDNIQIDTNA